MTWSSKLPRGVRRLIRLPRTRARMLREIDEELAAHFEMRVADLRALGLSEAEAQAEAIRRFGDTEEFRAYAARRVSRQARWSALADWLASWGQDVHFALRQFRKGPAFTAIAVITLALGIGANTAIFSVVHHLFVAQLPYPNGDRILSLRVASGGPGAFFAGLASLGRNTTAPPPRELVRAWTERARSLDIMAAAENQFLSTLPDGRQDTVTYAFASSGLLPMLGIQPAFGRGFAPADEQPGAPKVAMVSYEWWQRAYGARRDVLGKIVRFDEHSYAIVGVMPRGFTIPFETRQLDALSDLSPNVWLGARVTDMSNVFGRLRPGVTSSDAARELQVIANDVRIRNSPDTLRAHPMRAQDFLAPREVRTVQVLFAAVGALLLIACANVANLLLARAWTRRREFAIRMGLGAGRARLVRQALTESVLIALAAGAAGVLIAWQGLHLIIALRPLSLDHLGEVRVETPVLFWTAVISVATGLLFGAASALFSGSRSVGDLLRNETRTSSSGVTTGRIRSTLIVVEIAMSLVLLVGTGLLLRSFVALQGTPLGFDPHGLVSIDIITPQALRQQDKAVVAQAIVEQLRATPGVRDAGVGTLPTAGWNLPGTIETDAGGVVRAVPVSQFMTTFIDKNYLRTCDIRLLEGRLPERPVAAPGSPSPSPMSLAAEVVVNRALARRIALGGHAVGVRIRKGTNMDGPVPASDAWSTIVGVVDDVRLPGARGDLHEFQVYGTVDRRISPTFVVRFESTPPNVESILRQAIHGVSPQIVARRARVADDYLREALAPTRFAMSLLGAFALVAMLLSAVGLYGVIAYGVSQRTREIGIRVALGAEPKNVTSLVLGNGLRLTAGGIILGAALAVGATRALGSMLFDVAPSDPVTFVIIAFGVGAVALAAAYIPARRALRIDPTEALRSE